MSEFSFLFLQAGSCNQEKGKDKTERKELKGNQEKLHLETWVDWERVVLKEEKTMWSPCMGHIKNASGVRNG